MENNRYCKTIGERFVKYKYIYFNFFVTRGILFFETLSNISVTIGQYS